jgi:membrane-associated phospholipid phosphatase
VTNGWTWTPARDDVALSLRWAALLSALFFSVYGLCNWFTAQRETRHHLWFEWELDIPFVPEMIWVYLSLCVSFFLPMFALRAPALNALCKRLALAVLASGLVFLVLPAQPGFVRSTSAAEQSTAFRFLYSLDLPHNLVPSLHVSWSALSVISLRCASPPWLRRLFEVWFIALCASVLLVHQHHVLDVAGGVLVALAAKWAVRDDGVWTWAMRRQS